MSKKELPTFYMRGMGGSLPNRLTVEDGHGRPENAATEEHLGALLAVLPDEQRARLIGDAGPLVGVLSDKLNAYIESTKEAEKRCADLRLELEKERLLSALVGAELLHIEGVLVHGERHCRCDACEQILDDPDDFS